MYIFPSVDTGTCAASARRFNVEASKLSNTVVLCVGIQGPAPSPSSASAARKASSRCTGSPISGTPGFGKDYGVTFSDGPLQGLLARAVVVIDAAGTVLYTEQVAEIANEPNYAAGAIKALG